MVVEQRESQAGMHLRGGLLDGNLDKWVPLQHQLEHYGIQLNLDLYNPTIQPFDTFSQQLDFILVQNPSGMQKYHQPGSRLLWLYAGDESECITGEIVNVPTEKDLLFLLVGLAKNGRSSENTQVEADIDLYRKALEESSSAIVLLDDQGIILFANLPAYNSLLVDTHNSLIGEKFESFLGTEQQDLFSSFLDRLSASHGTETIRLAVRTRLNDTRQMDITGNALTSAPDQPRRYFCNLKPDETRLYRKTPVYQKQIAEAQSHPADMPVLPPMGNMSLDEHQKLLSSILESTTDIVVYTDPQHKIRFMNKAGIKRLGIRDLSELSKHSPLDFFCARDQAYMVNHVLPEAMRVGVSTGEYELVGLNGHIFPVSYVVQCHPTHEGEVYFSLLGRDISAEKAREKQLFEVKQLYETLAEAAQEYVCLTDPEWNVLFTNKATYDFFNLTQAEMVGKSYKIIVEKYAPQTFRVMQQIYRSKETVYIEDTVKIDSQQIWIGSWLVPVKNEDDEVTAILSVTRNISKEKETEYNLIQAFEKEREFNELQSRFVSMISHEFKTPLSTILSSIEILQTYGAQLSEEKKRVHTSRIEKAVSMMNSYLEDILVLGRIENHESKIQLVLVDPVAFCEELIEETLWNHKSSHPIKFVTTGSCLKALLDPSFLHQILDNVINNAINYSQPGSKILFTLNCFPDCLEFIIQDEGIGIPAADLEQIYDPFFRGASHPQVPGTGLGLVIVKRAVDLMKGEISINSQIGIGTEVRIQIPLLLGGSDDESDFGN